MQTLVLLLAPYVDFYMAIPALRALRRQSGNDTIHIVVRDCHVSCLPQMENVVIHGFCTDGVIEALIDGEDHFKALESLEQLLAPVKSVKFDRLFNLSFSALSSYLTEAFTSEATIVHGYTRFSDGTLCIRDDASAYVFAQVLENSPNRYHKTQIYAAALGVDLNPEDLVVGSPRESSQIVINLETSSHAYPAELWAAVVAALKKNHTVELILSGTGDQQELAKAIAPGTTFVKNDEVCLAKTGLFVTGASGMAARASLEGKAVLMICDRSTNFWECGPWSSGSRVMSADEIQNISVDHIVSECLSIKLGQKPVGPCWVRSNEQQTFQPEEIVDDHFGWDLLQALYTSGSYPRARTQTESLAFQRLFEISELALQSLATWSQNRKRTAENLQMVDELLLQVPQFCPAVGPVVRWFNTERIRLGPASEEDLLKANQKLFSDLFWISSVYREYADEVSSRQEAAELCQKCADSFREFDAALVASDFQKLLGVFHELARFSSKVGDQEWSGILQTLTDSFDRRDFIEVADQLEHVLGPQMNV